MARISWPVSTCWKDTKCQRPAGIQYDELHANVTTVQDVENQSEKNRKYRTSHISSNGYYGYLPVIPDIEDYAMDTSDAGAENSMGNGTDPKNGSCTGGTLTSTENVNVLSMGVTLGRRKRNSEEDNSTDEPKRQRKEEFCGLTPCQVMVLPTTRSFDAHYPRCIMGHYV